jgi:hypothetical protein
VQFAPVHAASPPEARSAVQVLAVIDVAQPLPPLEPAEKEHCAVAEHDASVTVGFVPQAVVCEQLPVKEQPLVAVHVAELTLVEVEQEGGEQVPV